MKIDFLKLAGSMLFLSNFTAGNVVVTPERTVTANRIEMEDKFLKHFEATDGILLGDWTKIGRTERMKLCNKVNDAAGMGHAIVNKVLTGTATLKFRNKRIESRVPVLTCDFEEPFFYRDEDSDRESNSRDDEAFHLTQGTRKDCVFILNLVDMYLREFEVQEEICGIESVL